MKKIVTFIIGLFAILLFGCKQESISNNLVVLTPVELFVPNTMVLVESVVHDEYYGLRNLGTEKDSEYIIYNSFNGDVKVVDFPEFFYGSSSTMVLGDAFYQWIVGSDAMKLISIDLNSGEVQTLEEKDYKTPFSYFFLLNDTQFLSYYNVKDNSEYENEYATLSIVELYNKNGESKEIIREKFENNDNWDSSKGVLIEGVFAVDEQLCGIGRKKNNGICEYYKYEFDLNGNITDEIKINAMDDIIEEEGILDVLVSGKVMAIKTVECLATYICKYDNNTVTQLEKGTICYDLISIDKDGEPKEYFVYSKSNVTANDTLDSTKLQIVLVDPQNCEETAVDLDIPIEKPYFVDAKVLANGDILVKCCEEKYTPGKIRHFLVSNKEIATVVA